MTPALYLNDLERQRDLLLHAARVARLSVKCDRDSLYECHYNPVTGKVDDALGLEALREYDATLGVIDLAIAAVDGEPVFHGLVIFQRNPVGGWRVFDHCEIGKEIRPLPLGKISVQHSGRLLGVCGTFRRRPRVGTWCKRPHEELFHAG